MPPLPLGSSARAASLRAAAASTPSLSQARPWARADQAAGNVVVARELEAPTTTPSRQVAASRPTPTIITAPTPEISTPEISNPEISNPEASPPEVSAPAATPASDDDNGGTRVALLAPADPAPQPTAAVSSSSVGPSSDSAPSGADASVPASEVPASEVPASEVPASEVPASEIPVTQPLPLPAQTPTPPRSATSPTRGLGRDLTQPPRLREPDPPVAAISTASTPAPRAAGAPAAPRPAPNFATARLGPPPAPAPAIATTGTERGSANSTPSRTATGGTAGTAAAPTQVAMVPGAGTNNGGLPDVTNGGGYWVQLTSQPSRDEADQAWGVLTESEPRLADLEPRIQAADLGDNRVFHRVRVGPFDASGAARWCDELKSSLGDCLVVRARR